MDDQVFLSVIVPVHNGSDQFSRCIQALKSSSYKSFEIIVVDDASTDDSAEIARKNGTMVLHCLEQSGPAAARNLGSKKARGDILLFIDSDVLVKPDTLARVVGDFSEHPHITAVFGSYDDDPADKHFFSQYKNLVHHFVHQQSNSDAVTFWAGCGAIRKDAFFSVGGFDERKYSRPCIEDIELGYRLKKAGYKILLNKNIQVKHLKEWTLKSLLRADIFYRAIPWTKLILETDFMVDDLNLQLSQRISAILVALMLLIIPISIFNIKLLSLLPFIFTLIIFLNYKLFAFFLKHKGITFAAQAFLMQILYFFYSGMTFTLCWALIRFSPSTK